MTDVPRFVLVFVDGLGLPPEGESTPLVQGAMPFLESVLGGTLAEVQSYEATGLLLTGLDACLGVEGTPQSATGQTALFSGVNASQQLGHHVTAFPGKQLKQILTDRSIFQWCKEQGYDCTFANAFTPQYFEKIAARKLRYSASAWSVLSADIPFLGLDELARGEALTWDIIGDLFGRILHPPVAPITAHRAGRNLVGIARRMRFTLYETFLSDLVGHWRIPEVSAGDVLRRIDGLFEGMVEELDARSETLTILMTSDHGNLEESSHRSHTRNPVPLLAIGRFACEFADCQSLIDVIPRMKELLLNP